MKVHSLIALIALTVSTQAGTPAPAPMTAAPQESGWWFRAAPYAWLTAIEGDAGIQRLITPVDISISDTLDSLDMGYMFVVEAGYGRWSLGVDVLYADVSTDIDAGNGPFFKSFRYEQTQWLLTPVVAWRAIETDGYHMDIFAGARINVLEAELTGRFVGGGQTTGTADTDWIDPIIGIRGQAELTDKLFLRYNGDIGGFGVESDLTWQVFLGLGVHLSDNVSAAIGYRALGVDYNEDRLLLDTVTHGPVIGLEVRF